MKTFCVYCGSKRGSSEEYSMAARELGEHMAHNGIRLVYGGAKIGLMGEVANGVLSQDGNVVGIQPKFLEKNEITHLGLSEYVSTASMHERKFVMYERSDAFIALPGGLGTFDELFEILTWKKLGLHKKPIGLVNVNGYFDQTVSLIQDSVEKGFSDPAVLEHFFVSPTPGAVVHSILADLG